MYSCEGIPESEADSCLCPALDGGLQAGFFSAQHREAKLDERPAAREIKLLRSASSGHSPKFTDQLPLMHLFIECKFDSMFFKK